MNVKNPLKIFLSILLFLTMAGMAVAEQQGNLPVDYFRTAFDELRVINGGLCTDLPDDAGTVQWYGYEVFCTGKTGVTSDMTGCVVHWRKSDRKLFKEEIINPGEKAIAPPEAAYWERYNCAEVIYTCDDYESEGCGESGKYADCADDEMLRVRSCSRDAPTSVETERCIPWYECMIQHCNVQVGEWSPCNSGRQSRTIIEADCSEWTDWQSCTIDCNFPDGEPGDIRCSGETVFECSSTGNWIQAGSCGGSPTTTQRCDNPDTPAGEVVCQNGFIKECRSDGTWKDTGDYCTLNEDIEEVAAVAMYDPSRGVVIGRVMLNNTGADMKDTYILEMQVRPKGTLPLAIVKDQEMCDPDHPENVHKEFMLKAGEEAVIELTVSQSYLAEGQYDVYVLTRHKCFKDLTPEQVEEHDEYNRVSPYPSAKKLGTVTVGNTTEAPGYSLWTILAFTLMIVGAVLVAFGILHFGLPVFAIGILILMIQAWV